MKEDVSFNVVFIEHVQQRPCLYDHNRADYKNINAQGAAWLEISKKVNQSVDDCKERWKNLRGCYTRHLKNVYKSSGSSAKRVKPYYLAEHLQFLDNYTKTRSMKRMFKLEEPNTEEEYEATNEIDDNSEYSHEFCASTPSQQSLVKRDKDDEKQDPDFAFFYSLLPDVKEMTSEQKRHFKMGVLQLVNDIFQTNSIASPVSHT